MRTVTVVLACILVAGCGRSEPKFTKMAGEAGEGDFGFVIPPETDSSKLPEIAKQACGGYTLCNVFGWQRPEDVAGALPLTRREDAALAFRYTLARHLDDEQSSWNCRIYPRKKKNECM